MTIVENTPDSDREVTTIEVIPPGGEQAADLQKEATKAEAPPPNEGPAPGAVQKMPRTPAERQVNAAANAQVQAAPFGIAVLKPQKGATLQGTATAMDTASGTALLVHVRLGVPGKYDVFMLDAARSCDERQEWSKPLVRAKPDADTWNIGQLDVSAAGTGALEMLMPQNAIPGGAHALDGRPIVVYEGGDKPMAAKTPLSCGTLRFSTEEEPVG